MQIIKYDILWQRLVGLLNPEYPGHIELEDQLSDTLLQGSDGVPEFLNRVNSDRAFRIDGVSLVPSDISFAPTVRDLMTAIINDYRREGWKVIF